MGTFTVTHDIDCDTATFWKTFFDQDFNVGLYKGILEFPDWKILEQTENDSSITRRVASQPKMDVPGPVKALIGSGFRYVEEGTILKAEGVWRWTMTPSTLAEKIKTEGSVRIEPLSHDRIRRIAHMTVTVRVFGVGGLIESSAEKQLRDGWDKSAAFMNETLAGQH
jgi:hypothetical protein